MNAEGEPLDDDTRVGVTFVPIEDGRGVEVIDPIERHRYTVVTPEPVDPRGADPDRFRYPVDAALAIEAGAVTLPTIETVYVRTADGEMLAETEHAAEAPFPAGTYVLEVCAPIKLYLRVEAAMTIGSDRERTRVEFDRTAEVTIGARSHHDNPAATVVTTPDPEGVMAAVSTFGSALKTTSPERSFPTLRGHPPLVELGDERDVPDGLVAPDTGVRIEVPPRFGPLYAVSPLAYYLGAEVVPGEEARLLTDRGLDAPLGPSVEAAAGRLLKRAFFLDCLVRTEGHYRVDLHERRAVEDRLDLEIAALYRADLAERLEAYLAVDYGDIEDHVPTWGRTAHVEPTPTSVETLPFLIDDLATVRSARGGEAADSPVREGAVEEFLRSGTTRSAAGGGATRTTAGGAAGEKEEDPYIHLESAGAVEKVWLGEETPVGGTKALREGFEHRLGRTPTTGHIDITVVCNDPAMADEREAADGIYRSQSNLPFDVTVHHALTTDELRDVLTSPTEFLHYIGHIDHEGFECADGKLDATTLGSVDVDAFLLNACESYRQGTHLVEAGAIGGVVTVNDVINSEAVRIGRVMARLLNQGFPLYAALEIARGESIIGSLYIVVGDGAVSVAQSNPCPTLLRVERPAGDEGEGEYGLEYVTYPTKKRGLGTMVVPYVADNDRHHLISGVPPRFELSEPELASYLMADTYPVRIDGELEWSDELSL